MTFSRLNGSENYNGLHVDDGRPQKLEVLKGHANGSESISRCSHPAVRFVLMLYVCTGTSRTIPIVQYPPMSMDGFGALISTILIWSYVKMRRGLKRP